MAARMSGFFDDDRPIGSVVGTRERKDDEQRAGERAIKSVTPHQVKSNKTIRKPISKKPIPTTAVPIPSKNLPKILAHSKEEFNTIVKDLRSFVFEKNASKNKKADTKKAIRQFTAAKAVALGGKLEKGVGHSFKHYKEMQTARKKKMDKVDLNTEQVTASKQWLEPLEAARAKERKHVAKKGRADASKLIQLGRVPSQFRRK